MAISPGRWDITPQRRADYPFEIHFEDSSGNPMVLTGYQILAQVWNPERTQKLGDFTVTIIDAINGRVKFNLPFSVTTNLPYDCRYDIMLIDPSGLREFYVEGLVQVSEGYTSPS